MSSDWPKAATDCEHHPRFPGLMRKSVGKTYPLSVVGFGDGTWGIQNLLSGQWFVASSAEWADALHDSVYRDTCANAHEVAELLS